MALSHTTHSQHGRAVIVQHGGTPRERIVGVSRRTKKATYESGLFYLYRVTDNNNRCVYEGSSIGEGMKRLEATLKD